MTHSVWKSVEGNVSRCERTGRSRIHRTVSWIGAVKGIGRLWRDVLSGSLKEDTFRIIEEEPERLAEIKGISERKARDFITVRR